MRALSHEEKILIPFASAKITLTMVGRVWTSAPSGRCLGRQEKMLVGRLCGPINSSTYGTISFNSAGPVTRDGPAEILVSAGCQNHRDILFFWQPTIFLAANNGQSLRIFILYY
jgi:hypothetical protein